MEGRFLSVRLLKSKIQKAKSIKRNKKTLNAERRGVAYACAAGLYGYFLKFSVL